MRAGGRRPVCCSVRLFGILVERLNSRGASGRALHQGAEDQGAEDQGAEDRVFKETELCAGESTQVREMAVTMCEMTPRTSPSDEEGSKILPRVSLVQ